MSAANIHIKLREKTTSDATDLCRTCVRSQIYIHTNNKKVVFCNSLGRNIHYPVAECSSYYNKSLPNLETLYDTAWILTTNKGGKTIGFQKYTDWKKKNKNEDLIPEY